MRIVTNRLHLVPRPNRHRERTVPPGEWGCYVEFTLKPQTADEDGDFLQAEVTVSQVEIAGT